MIPESACAGARGGREPTPGSATGPADRHRHFRPSGTARRQRDRWIAGQAEISPVQAARGWVHRTPRKPRKAVVRGFWKGEFPGNWASDSNFGESLLVGRMPAELVSSMLVKPERSITPSQRTVLRGHSRPPRGTEDEFQAAIRLNFLQDALSRVPERPVARMADKLSVSHTRHASYGPSPEAFRCRIRPNSAPGPTSWPENPAPRGPQRWCRPRCLQVGVAQGGHGRRERHSGGDGGDAEVVTEALRAWPRRLRRRKFGYHI